MSRRLLALSYAFPPIAAPESFLSAKILGNLENYTVDVVCASPNFPRFAKDDSLLAYVNAKCNSISRITAPPYFRIISPRGKVRSRPKCLFKVPDSLLYLNDRAYRKIKQLNPGSYDCLLTWSTWHSAHLVGLRIKREYPSLPWVVHLSDPWVDNPFDDFRGRIKLANEKMEREVVEQCDTVAVTTEETRDLISAKYGQKLRKKFIVIPHAFDSSLYMVESVKPRETDRVKFLHLGNFYGIRSPSPLFDAIRALLVRDMALASKVQFDFYGSMSKVFQSQASDLIQAGIVKIFKPVPYLESLALMASADILLIIDAPADTSVFLPSKLIDYLGAKRAILGITPEGASKALLDRLKMPVVNPLDQEGIVATIDSLVREKDLPVPSAEIVAEYAAKTVCRKTVEAIAAAGGSRD